MADQSIRDVFIVGSKGIPAAYGGFESFVDCLTLHQKNPKLRYHVSCAFDRNDEKYKEKEFLYHGARCFCIPWRKLGPARAIVYDIEALQAVVADIQRFNIKKPVVYVLACRIGPFLKHFARKIHQLGGRVLVNPDGHEWKRSKWSAPVRAYWKLSERLMVKHCDLLVCDSQAIRRYICRDYKQYCPATVFIPYGAETAPLQWEDAKVKFIDWCKRHTVSGGSYYLVVARLVPENNFETIIREFLTSDTEKDLVLITDTKDSAFYQTLRQDIGFESDKRIKFVGAVYDGVLLKAIREQAYAYLHGHQVGGTNPSLLESMGSTNLNLLLEVEFNKEVGEECVCYWTKEKGSLCKLIHQAEQMTAGQIKTMGQQAKDRMRDHYSWQKITDEYESLFLQ